jgi:hypothetical protein
MSLILPTKRQFLQSLFIAPAIVSSTNIMKVKAFEAIETVTGVSGHTWNLIKNGETFAWMSSAILETYNGEATVISKIDLPEAVRINRTMETVSLMKIQPGTVVWDLPSHYTKAPDVIPFKKGIIRL